MTVFLPKPQQPELIREFARMELSRYLDIMMPHCAQPEITFEIRSDETTTLDGFHAYAQGNCIHICATQDRGFLYGAYALLERLGCRFSFSLVGEESIPSLAALPDIEPFSESPLMEARGLCLYGLSTDSLEDTLRAIDWMAKQRFNLLLASEDRLCDAVENLHGIRFGAMLDKLGPELLKRGIILNMSEHSTDVFFPRDELFPQHPEWFALIDGQRVPLQMCYANEEATDYYASQLADYAARQPQAQMLGVWPLDGEGYCTCEACRHPDTIARAVAKVARAVHAVRPDIVVEHLAYKPGSFPVPSFPLEDNMCVLVCHKTDETAHSWLHAMRGRKGAYYFEYNTANHYTWLANPWLLPGYCRWITAHMAQLNYVGMVSLFLPMQAWWTGAINCHFLRKAAWSPAFDMESALDELTHMLLGRHAQHAKRALQVLLEKVQRPELWQRAPFADINGFGYDSCRSRNPRLDQLRRQAVQAGVAEALALLAEVPEEQLTREQLRHLRCLRAYAELQGMFHELVDSYDGDRHSDPQARLAPLLAQLEQLQGELDGAFIAPAYAQWRLLGRDNIFRK